MQKKSVKPKIEDKKMSMVSIIILNYNTFNLTCNCIRSIYKHTTATEFEIIVVDNASVECDAELLKNEFLDIILIKSSQNIGFAKGNNLGIAQAKGDYVLLLNSDTELLNDALSIAKQTLEQADRLGAVSVELQYPDGTVQRQCQHFPSVSRTLIEKLRLHRLLPPATRGRVLLSSYHTHNAYMEPDVIWGTFFMFKKSLLQKLPDKKLDDTYFIYYEDIKWCFDIKKAGYRVAYQPKGKVMHIIGQSNAPNKKEIIEKNKADFLKKNYPAYKALLLSLLR